MGAMRRDVETGSEKRKAGLFVRPNFDKTPNWPALTQAPNRGRSCSGYRQKASLSGNTFGCLATEPGNAASRYVFNCPGSFYPSISKVEHTYE
jgi:hypothetical protein